MPQCARRAACPREDEEGVCRFGGFHLRSRVPDPLGRPQPGPRSGRSAPGSPGPAPASWRQVLGAREGVPYPGNMQNVGVSVWMSGFVYHFMKGMWPYEAYKSRHETVGVRRNT